MIFVFGMYREKPVTFKLEFRKKEANDLKKMLMENFDDPPKIIKVVGSGGIGRRALLMYVYEHALIKQHFQIRVRVSLPAGVSDTSIVEEILKKTGQRDPRESAGTGFTLLGCDRQPSQHDIVE